MRTNWLRSHQREIALCLFEVVTMVLVGWCRWVRGHMANKPPANKITGGSSTTWTTPPGVDFCPFSSISTLLCSFANEFICTSPFLSQHINPDHWSHPHGKNGLSPTMEGLIGLTFSPWHRLLLDRTSAPFQHRTNACSTSCPSVAHSTLARHDRMLTSHGVQLHT